MIAAMAATNHADFSLIQKKETKTHAPPIRKITRRYQDNRRLRACSFVSRLPNRLTWFSMAFCLLSAGCPHLAREVGLNPDKREITNNVGVHGFKGSEVQGSILDAGLHLGCVFTRKASASLSLIQNLEPNWQVFREMRIFNEDFQSLMPSLSLTLNAEPWTCERLPNIK